MLTDTVLKRYQTPAEVTVHLPTPSAVEDADDQLRIRLDILADQITDAADGQTARRVTAAIRGSGHAMGRSIVAVADADDVQVWPVDAELDLQVTAGPLPHLGRLIAEQQARVPHAVVLVDRTGADIDVVLPTGHRTLHVEGDTEHVTKVQPGGWSQRRFQQRAEETWEDNAALVADRLSQLHGDLDLVLLAGDETMLALLQELLPAPIREKAEILEVGGRAADGSEAHLAKAVDQTVRQHAERRLATLQQQVIGDVAEGRGVRGRAGVLRALFESRARQVVLHLDDADGILAHVGDEPQQVAADASSLHDLGLQARRVPLSDAVLRAASATGADVIIATEAVADLTDGVAATLR